MIFWSLLSYHYKWIDSLDRLGQRLHELAAGDTVFVVITVLKIEYVTADNI